MSISTSAGNRSGFEQGATAKIRYRRKGRARSCGIAEGGLFSEIEDCANQFSRGFHCINSEKMPMYVAMDTRNFNRC